MRGFPVICQTLLNRPTIQDIHNGRVERVEEKVRFCADPYSSIAAVTDDSKAECMRCVSPSSCGAAHRVPCVVLVELLKECPVLSWWNCGERNGQAG